MINLSDAIMNFLIPSYSIICDMFDDVLYVAVHAFVAVIEWVQVGDNALVIPAVLVLLIIAIIVNNAPAKGRNRRTNNHYNR